MSDPQSTPPPNDSESNHPSIPPAAEPQAPPKKPLTPEEQMALYEENLKETDWGHQPC